MKQGLLITGLLLLVGCTGITEYADVIPHPAPADVAGYWQSVGPQSELVSPEALATLVVMADGETLDCRQWQRVIAVPGKLTRKRQDEGWLNITEQQDIYPLALNNNQLAYGGMTLQRVSKLTPECALALEQATEAQRTP
ncbi:lipoprotein YedD [Citrobacter sp. JGM124]|uniref:lipoprotein YedD n=1 Tax=Citrobacter sp. JGM124 TaxID=2799789 RepID=UPI001BA97C48|nr:lipoprotein YedD [Citrobacter sp. JGM124]MBS0846960.1 lipoprotein [Citrobacter sp. JGM124]